MNLGHVTLDDKPTEWLKGKGPDLDIEVNHILNPRLIMPSPKAKKIWSHIVPSTKSLKRPDLRHTGETHG